MKGNQVFRRGMVQGSDLYKRASTEQYTVDKTLLIKEVLEDPSKVIIFTRPRRFGKSLNLDMLRVFFEKADEDNSAYFRNRNIWKEGEAIRNEQGRYPVIFLTLKDVIYRSLDLAQKDLKILIAHEYKRHPELEDSPILSEDERRIWRKTVWKEISEAELECSILNLMEMLCKVHGEKVILIIDEYDTPIINAKKEGFYDEFISFFHEFYLKALESSPCLKKAFIAGILKIEDNNLFSGIHHITFNTVLDEKYSSFFGFTKEEVMAALSVFNAESLLPEIEEWYEGYTFGSTVIYNPWNIACAINNCRTGAYWVDTGNDKLIRDLIRNADENELSAIRTLLEMKAVEKEIPYRTNLSENTPDIENILTLLLFTGYLTGKEKDSASGEKICSLSIPNMEVGFEWQRAAEAEAQP